MNGIYFLVDGQIHLSREAIAFCPVMSKMTDANLKYLVAVYDYVDSPLRGQSIDRRKPLAISFFFKDEKDRKRKIEEIEAGEDFPKAVEELQSIIYDVDKYTREVYVQKLERINGEIPTATAATLEKLLSSSNKLREQISLLDTRIEKADVERLNVKLKGDRTLSLLETWRIKREQYQRMNAKS